MAEQFRFEREWAYHGLVEFIMSGIANPDEPLSERKFADSLEIGRTPVREAMRDLVRDGLLEVSPARGTYVRSFTTQEVCELYEVRQGLEGLAAELAAQRGATPELKAYGPLFRHTLEHPDNHDPEEVYDTGARFHLDLCRAAGNRQLLSIYQPLRLRFQLALALPRYFDHARVHESVAEHLGILEAIEAGDSSAARRLICEHLTRGVEVRTRIVTEMAKSRRSQPNALTGKQR
jgi:DNA-binding GntR family transcriptional regulator